MKCFVLVSMVVLVLSPGLSVRAESGQVRLSTVNMPPGWQWPPTDAIRRSGEQCLAELADAGVEFERLSQPLGRVATPVVVPSMMFGGLQVQHVGPRRAPAMDCHMALSLAQHAKLVSGLGIRALIAAGFYQNRRARVGGQTLAVLSRHALGLAVDIRGLVTDQGTTLWVGRDYAHPLFGRLEAALLEQGQLRALVSPRNDPGHRGHLHLSAKMTIDAQHPDVAIDIADLLTHLAHRQVSAEREVARLGEPARLQPAAEKLPVSTARLSSAGLQTPPVAQALLAPAPGEGIGRSASSEPASAQALQPTAMQQTLREQPLERARWLHASEPVPATRSLGPASWLQSMQYGLAGERSATVSTQP